jgi:hypothetical protein
MPTLPARAAAYTRTRILQKFLELLSDATPARVDNGFVEGRLGLKGGDVRAFLQSLRVLGLIDPYGGLTERARRTRAQTQRAAAMREALKEAYPELVQVWQSRGEMPREEVEDFFKLDYGLSTSTAGPAGKLFCDLMREYGGENSGFRVPGSAGAGAGGRELPRERGAAGAMETVSLPRREEWAEPLDEELPPLRRAVPLSSTEETRRLSPTPPVSADVRLAALEAIKSSLRIDINADWEPEKIQLVFDRMERLMQRILE